MLKSLLLAAAIIAAFPAFAACPDPDQINTKFIADVKAEGVEVYDLKDPDGVKALSQISVAIGGEPLPPYIAEVVWKEVKDEPAPDAREYIAGFTSEGCFGGVAMAPLGLLYSIQQTEAKKAAAPKS